MKALSLALLALVLAVPLNASAAGSFDAWRAQSNQTAERALANAPSIAAHGQPGFVPLAIGHRPDATAPAFFANFVATGENAAYVPCFGCVHNVGATIGLPAPTNYVPKNTYWQFNVSWTNITYKGACTVAYAVIAGGKTLHTAATKLANVSGIGAFDWGWQASPITFSGPAIAYGRITCGSTASTVSSNMYFE